MVKLFGVTLTAAACAWIGFRRAGVLRLRARAMREVEQGLLLLEQELKLYGAPLPELMERLSRKSGGWAAQLFSNCHAGLEELESSTLSQIWSDAVSACPVLGEECILTLLPLGAVLGQCGEEAQINGVSTVREQLKRLSRSTEEEYSRQGSVYRILGVSGGAFLVILLL